MLSKEEIEKVKEYITNIYDINIDEYDDEDYYDDFEN